jgi:hypothetical protein
MKRANGFFLFLLIFLLLTAAVFLINYICFRDFFIENTPQAILLFSVSQATLTHFSDQSIGESSSWFQLFSILSTQAAGLMFYTMLLWLFHQLFSEKKAEHYSLKKAFTTTLLVSAICELALFAFFLYGIPAALTDGDFSQKILAALTLAVNSFNNAGFSLGSLFFETGIVANNFMIQIGIIGGALLGGLGIFVLIDLFSPVRLRRRLHDPGIDWSFMTKLSLYGGVGMLAGFLMLFLFTQKSILFDKNILESMAMGLMEATAARGFGLHISAAAETGISSIAYYFLAFTGSGPFTTGGGASLLGLLFIYGIFKKKSTLPENVYTGYMIARKWVIFSIAVITLALILNLAFNADIGTMTMIDIYLTNSMVGSSMENLSSLAIKTLTNIAGRISFILACFMTLPKNI